MLQWILNLKLRVKLLLAFGSIILLSGLLMVKSFNTIEASNDFQKVSEVTDGLNIHLLEINNSIQYFTFEGYKFAEFQKEGRSIYISHFQENLMGMKEKIEAILGDEIQDRDTTLAAMLESSKRIENNFYRLTRLLKERGFKDFGLEGLLREAIHQVERSPFPYNKADMLTLRRHEKDFFLRRDLKYPLEFNKKVESFVAEIESATPSAQRDEIIDLLRSYQSKFNQVVSIEEQIGLQEQDGLKKVIADDLNQLTASTLSFRQSIKNKSRLIQQQAWFTLIFLFGLQLAVGIALAIFYSDQITKSVKELQRAMRSFADGIFPPKLDVRSHEEIGKTKVAFNDLLDRIKAAQDFSFAMGNGKLSNTYPEVYREDMLAKSLIQMQKQLKEAFDKQRIINWNNQGAAQLNEILKAENEEIATLGDRIIKMLVQYLQANQGALYLVYQQQEDKWAERISTYAFNKKKFIEQRIDAGSGLIGQCLLEKDAIIITQVPLDYVKITSGLGEAVPRFILIVPLLVNGDILGIVEIASFEEMEKYQIEFMERISRNIASILANKKINVETAFLLKEARDRAQQLAIKEEIIRQNTEEMQAITEQLQRDKKEMQNEINSLRIQLSVQVEEEAQVGVEK